MPCYDLGTLRDVIARDGKRAPDLDTIALHIACGLKYLHGKNFIHRDIKPSNIAVVQHHNQRFSIKILDFGIAKAFVEGEMMTDIGTAGYKAPEVRNGCKCSFAVDVYGYGKTLRDVKQCGVKISQNSNALKLVDTGVLTRRQPEDRPSMTEIVDQLNCATSDFPDSSPDGTSDSDDDSTEDCEKKFVLASQSASIYHKIGKCLGDDAIIVSARKVLDNKEFSPCKKCLPERQKKKSKPQEKKAEKKKGPQKVKKPAKEKKKKEEPATTYVYVITTTDTKGRYHFKNGCYGAKEKVPLKLAKKEDRSPCSSCISVQ